MEADIKNYSPLVSIVLIAYNHLAYTKQCVESLYRYTSHIDFELITINNGSRDGTREYFGSLQNAIKLEFPENIGVDKAINHGFKIAKGKYTLNLSNDIVLTHNWLDNLLAVMEADESAGMAVPLCNASSNNQMLDVKFADMEEMQAFAKKHNKSDPRLWEERMRLVTYTCLFRTDLQKVIGGFDEDFNPGAYDDDAISFTIRRAGYKLVLACDTFVFHYGSVTFNDEYRKDNLALRNQQLFFQKFGVYSWNASFIDFNIINLVDFKCQDGIKIFGMGSSCGATLLQIKNMCKAYGSTDIGIYYLSETQYNLTDLKTICEHCTYSGIEDITQNFTDYYDYIVVESESDKIPNIAETFTVLASILSLGGQIICTAANTAIYEIIVHTLTDCGLKDLKCSADNYYLCLTKGN